MLLKSLTLTAAGLAAANALLVPPELSESLHQLDDIVNALPVEVPKIAQSQTLNLNCPGCPLFHHRGHRGSFRNKHTIPNHLELSFNIDHDTGSDRLTVNGFELYPNADPFSGTLSAPQIPDVEWHHGSRKPKAHGSPLTPPLGFSLQVNHEAQDNTDNMDLINLNLQIIEVGSNFVDGIQNVQIKLIQSLDGALMIGDIHATESQTAQESPKHKHKECSSILCKWRAMIADRLKGHCPGKMGMGKIGHHMGHHKVSDEQVSERPEKNMDDEVAQMYRDRSFGQLLHKFASHIIFPVLIGIVAGVSVSIIGMLVGTFIVGIWRVVVRGQPFFRRQHHCRRRGLSHSHHHRKSSRSETASAEEKSGLMEQQEALPAYDEEQTSRETA